MSDSPPRATRSAGAQPGIPAAVAASTAPTSEGRKTPAPIASASASASASPSEAESGLTKGAPAPGHAVEPPTPVRASPELRASSIYRLSGLFQIGGVRSSLNQTVAGMTPLRRRGLRRRLSAILIAST
ncbi:MAG TPA: hypothetical protein VFH68_23655, partial [Polyangia bacterium]|nr:hypothetical protein [Polyangia bacterium]